MDAQDAQDNQDPTLVHERLTPAMTASGLADVQDCKPTFFRKILCILCIDVNKPLTPA